MGDVNRLEHVWSHCLGYLSGAYISTAIIVAGAFVLALVAVFVKFDYIAEK